MSKPDDLSKPLVALDHDSTLVCVIEMSGSSWLVATTVPGVDRRPLQKRRRWPTEDAFETAKSELGPVHNEARSWHGWHRHGSLVLLAFAMLMVIRHRADTVTSPPKADRPFSEIHSIYLIRLNWCVRR
jgi:hypothetical protein